MHGLIFKIKESHRQDQSESFVIYIYLFMHIHKIKFMYIHFFFFHNKSNEITSLWPVFIIFYIHINVYYVVVSSRRNKTNPHHKNKFIPFLNATHLQAFKPKLLTYDQLLKIDQQNVSLYICMRKLKHFQPHSLLCHLWCILFANCSFFMWYIYIWSFEKVDEAASTNFFLFYHIQYFSHC